MDPSEGAQPDETTGQDAGAQPEAPYAEYLSNIPEDARPFAEEAFKKWDGDVTRRFQEAAEFRKQFEPYQEILNGRQPDEIKWGLEFREAAMSNPQAIQQWFKDYAAEHGLEAAQEAAQTVLEDDYTDPSVEAILEQRLTPLQQQLEQLTAREQQRQEAQALAEAQSLIESQLAEQKEKLGDDFNADAIDALTSKYIATDPLHAVERAAQDWVAIRNQIVTSALQGKVDTSRPAAEGGGVADGAAPEIKTLKDAARIATEQLRGAGAA